MKTRFESLTSSDPLRCVWIALTVLSLPISGLRADDRAPAGSPATAETPKPVATPRPRTADSAVTPVNGSPKRHAEFMARKEQGPLDLLFLGASITEFWPQRAPDSWARFTSYHPANFGVAGEATEQVLWRITHGELDGIHPRVVVVNLGNNNIGQHPDERTEWVVAGMRKVVDVIREKLPDTKILLLAIFPRDAKESSNRLRNDAVNVELAKFAEGDQVRYLDLSAAFLGADGELLPGVLLPDQLHPTAKGYQAWYDAMLPTLSEMMR